MKRGLGSSIAAALASVLLAFGLAATGAHAAVVLVPLEGGITPNGLIDWGVLGPENTSVTQPITIDVPNVFGLNVKVSQTIGAPFVRVDQGSTWAGNFGLGEKLLWTNGNNGPISLAFNSPVQGVGAQIQGNIGVFTASIEAFNSSNASLGSFMLLGNSTNAGNDSAIFIGILSNALDISRVVFGVPVANPGGGGVSGVQNFAINGPRIQVTPVPEPKTYAMLMAGLGLLGLIARRRRKSLNAAA